MWLGLYALGRSRKLSASNIFKEFSAKKGKGEQMGLKLEDTVKNGPSWDL